MLTTPVSPPPVDKSGARIRAMFGEISARYDFLNHFLSGGTDYYWRWQTVRRTLAKNRAAVSTAPILDVCTGTGDLALAYWKRGCGKIPVVGADFTHEMLVVARHKGAKLARTGEAAAPLEFLEADTLQLPFPDAQFQLVSVAFGLRNVSDTLGGLREMTRVCQPGGKVVVLEFSLPTSRLLRGSYQWYFRNILPRIGQLVARNQHLAYSYLPQSVAQFPQGEELAGMFRACGLTDVTWTPFTFGVATLYVGTKP